MQIFFLATSEVIIVDDIRAAVKPPASPSSMVVILETASPGRACAISREATTVFSVAQPGYLRLGRAKSLTLRNNKNDAPMDGFGFVCIDQRRTRFG